MTSLSPKYILPEDNDFKADLVIIATKFDGLHDAICNIKNFVKEDTIILSLLNGVTSEEIIAKTYGWSHVPIAYYIGHSAMRDGNNITQDLYDYLFPLIQVEVNVNYQNGIPAYYSCNHLNK